MMYKRQSEKLAVVRVNTDVLDLPGVVISDGNAVSDKYTRFWPSPSGLFQIDKDLVFAESWNDSNQIEKWRKSRIKCAEVLVPDKVETRFILGFYVPNMNVRDKVAETAGNLAVDVDAHLFFRD